MKMHEGGYEVFYATISFVAAAIAAWVLVLFARARSDPDVAAIESRRSWICGLVLLALGAVFYLVGAINPPGADLGEDLEFRTVVDGLGGGFVATGYALGAMLAAFLLLGAVDPTRAGRLLVRVGIGAVPLAAVLTALTIAFDRSEWNETNIGPLVGCMVFFSLPAWATGSLLLHAAPPASLRRHALAR